MINDREVKYQTQVFKDALGDDGLPPLSGRKFAIKYAPEIVGLAFVGIVIVFCLVWLTGKFV